MEGMNAPPSQVFGSHSFVTPLVISVIGTISTALALLFYHYILSNFCFRRQRRPPAGNITTTGLLSNHDLHQPERHLLKPGVDKKILETIPILPYQTKQGYLFRVDQTECVVCLGELEHGELVRLLPICKHAFHVPCIDQWFVAQNSCPICRSPLTEPACISYPATLLFPPCVEGITRDYYHQRCPAPPPPDQDCSSSSNTTTAATTTRRVVADDVLNYGSSAASSSSVHQQSSCSLRHCTSLALPIDRKKSRKRTVTGLKRSLSMDQSSVIINIQSESQSSGRDNNNNNNNNNNNCSSPSPSSPADDSVTRRLYRAPSLKQSASDRVSAKLLRSLSRLRTGRNTEILPY